MFTPIIFVVLFITLVLPLTLYVGSLDWSRKHTKKVTSLPEFSTKADSGQYRLKANGFEFVLRVAGLQNTGQNLILLHGFPESSLMWQALLDQAAQAGYRVVAFDQRGYSPLITDKLETLMQRGHQAELADKARLPASQLVEDGEFAFPGVPADIDYAIAFAVFTHLPLSSLCHGLARVRAAFPDLNRLLFTVFLAPDAAPERAHRQPTRFALLFIDLDRFKPVNDLHGHDAGDVAQQSREGDGNDSGHRQSGVNFHLGDREPELISGDKRSDAVVNVEVDAAKYRELRFLVHGEQHGVECAS